MEVKLNKSTILNVIKAQKGNCLHPIEIKCCECPLSGRCHIPVASVTIADIREHRLQLALQQIKSKRGI
jgi:hypothetical protein